MAARARSRSSGAACSAAVAPGASGGRISISIGPGLGSAPLGGNARRVPRSTAGTSGQAARVAVAKAPV